MANIWTRANAINKPGRKAAGGGGDREGGEERRLDTDHKQQGKKTSKFGCVCVCRRFFAIAISHNLNKQIR